jgi:hypothetical protein
MARRRWLWHIIIGSSLLVLAVLVSMILFGCGMGQGGGATEDELTATARVPAPTLELSPLSPVPLEDVVTLRVLSVRTEGDELVIRMETQNQARIVQYVVQFINGETGSVVNEFMQPVPPYDEIRVPLAVIEREANDLIVQAFDAEGNLLADAALGPTAGITTNDGGTEEATEAFPLPTEEMTEEGVEIANAALVIVDTSGAIIGDGTLRVFYPERLQYPQTGRVELELRLDNRYITPTPAGPVTAVPVTPVTSTPLPGRPTPTPRVSRYEESGLQVYERMGAALICLPASFEGCDEREPLENTKVIRLSGATWSWIISPRQNVTGLQDLRLELWTLVSVDGAPERPNVVWEHPFQIEVRPASSGSFIRDNLGAIITAGATIAAALIGVYFTMRRRQVAQAALGPRRRPKVFISYRRKDSWGIARTIHDSLSARGADVFIDVDDINEGRFEDIIKKNIEGSDYFILVLAPTTLESEWVVKEARHAIEHNQKIIPVLVDGFNLYDYKLPEDLQKIKSHNAISLTPEFFNAGIDRLAQFVGLGSEKAGGQ